VSVNALVKFLDRLQDWEKQSAVDEWFFANIRDGGE
jgi:hypothetical protein